MACSFAVRNDITKEIKEKYTNDIEQMSLAELVLEFFSYLDYTESHGEDDHTFHPIYISNCRVLMGEPLAMVITRLKLVAQKEASNGQDKNSGT